MQDLLKAIGMYQDSVSAAATTSAVTDASRMMQDINTGMLEDGQKRQALQGLGNQLALKLVGTGADASKIQAAFNAVNPQAFGSVEQMQLEGALSGNKQYNQTAGSILKGKEDRSRSMKMFESDLDIKKEIVKGELDIRKAQMQAAAKMKSFNIPDFSVQPGINPNDDDLKSLKKANIGMKRIDSALGELDELVEKHGTVAFSPTSNLSKRMSLLKTNVLMEMKDQFGLGALAGPDITQLEAAIPDPTKFFGNKAGYQEAVKTFKQELYNRVSSEAEARGFKYDAVPKSMESLVETYPLKNGKRVRVIKVGADKYKVLGPAE